MKLSRKLILASASPRRKFLLSELGLDFEVRPTDVDEVLPKGYSLLNSAAYLSELKLAACSEYIEAGNIVLTADSVVIHDNKLIGKPADELAAAETLRSLSGSQHTVVTGFSVSFRQNTGEIFYHTQSVRTEVQLVTLTESEIKHYIQSAKPFDKAGSYGIQDWIGWAKVTSIQGSYSNVMGLPTAEVYAVLTKLAISGT